MSAQDKGANGSNFPPSRFDPDRSFYRIIRPPSNDQDWLQA
jgi:hypothetical protein